MTESNHRKPEDNRAPEIPANLVERLGNAVPRQWLRDRIEQALEGPQSPPTRKAQTILIIGEPGTGKTVLAAQLAVRWRCPIHFIRVGSVGGVTSRDPKNVLISLGLQLRTLYGSEIFGAPSLEVSGALRAGKISKEGKAAVLQADVVSLSPFRRVLIDADLHADEIAGEALLVRIGELRDVVVDLTPAQLAQEAIIHPLQRLASIRPNERARIIVDALDDNLEVAECLPLGDDSLPNVDWVLMSRPGDHLNRFPDSDGISTVVRLNLSDPAFINSSLEDARKYAGAVLQDPSFSVLFELSPAANRPLAEFAFDLARASKGNFLYLYHLMQAIRSEAEAGRFELLARPADSLPKGLDGIYRYFITDLILPKASLRDWVDLYAPVLGVLAVARAALSSSQLAAFSHQDQLIVNRVLGSIRPFLETLSQGKYLAYSFYHPSFAEFLLSQDEARNPYPLRPSGHYHSMIADYYRPLDASAWTNTTDRYAMLHLPSHLLETGAVEAVCHLLSGPFGERQAVLVGAAQTWVDVAATARAAANSEQDELFFRMVDASAGIEAGAKAQWESGRYVLGLLSQDPTEILERTGYQESGLAIGHSGWALPWSGFLVAERLMDLAAIEQGLEVLRQILRRPWPENQPRQADAINMMEGSSFDFASESPTITFLAKVAQFEPNLALNLARRLYTDEPKLPNARTAWRDVIASFCAWRSADQGSPATAVQCEKLAETTCEWLRKGGYVLGWAGVTQGLFHLLARSLPVADPLWLVNSILLASECRMAAQKTIQGASEEENGRPGLWAAWADLLAGLMEIKEKLPSETGALAPAPPECSASEFGITEGKIRRQPEYKGGEDRSRLGAILDETVHKITEGIPHIDTPTRASYGPRVAYLARLAFALNQAGSDRWREYTQAALAACSLDMGTKDPPKTAVVEALAWLRRIPDPSLHATAENLISHLDLRRSVEAEEAVRQKSESNGNAPALPSIRQLAEATDSFERGRVVLALWSRSAAGLRELEAAVTEPSAPRPKGKRSRSDDDLQPTFIELFAESLTTVLAQSPAPWVGEAIAKLDACRRPERRAEVRLDKASLEIARLRALAARKDWEQFRPETEKQWQAALADRNYTKALGICMLTISFDPDLTNLRYLELRKNLKKQADRGTAVVSLIFQLKNLQPERLNDLGREWVRDLPPPGPAARISRFHLRICEQWGDLDLFRSQVVAHLDHLADVLPNEMEDILLQAAQSERRRNDSGGAEQPEEKDSGPEENDAWRLAGEVLKCVSQVVIREQDGSARAAQRLASSVTQMLNQIIPQIPEWEVRARARTILEQMTKDAEGLCKPGPIADAALQLFSIATMKSDEQKNNADAGVGHDLRSRQDTLLGLSLAAHLKQAKPEWSNSQFNAVITTWESLVEGKPSSAGWMDSMVEGFVDLFTSVVASPRSRFRNNRDRELFNLTKHLSAWCTSEPSSPDRLVQLQALVGRVNDADLRNLLLAPLAVAWMHLDDVKRTSHLLQLAGPGPLAKAGFHDSLRSQIRILRDSHPSADAASYKAMVLDLILLTPLQAYDDAFEDTITSWILLRAEELATKCGTVAAESRYLERLLEWTLSTANRVPRMRKHA